MAKKPAHVAPPKEKDVDYTVAGLIAIVAIVLFTAIFFRGLPDTASTGAAYETGTTEDPDAPDECEVMSFCDGTRLVRQHDDCNRYIAFCQYGCEEIENGIAQCR